MQSFNISICLPACFYQDKMTSGTTFTILKKIITFPWIQYNFPQNIQSSVLTSTLRLIRDPFLVCVAHEISRSNESLIAGDG